MTIILCISMVAFLIAMSLFIGREMFALINISVSSVLHAVSIILIVVASLTRGIWFHSNMYLVDIWVIVDAIHKNRQEIVSNSDYFNPIGPAMDWILAFTKIFQQKPIYSFVLANVIVAIFCLILSFALLRRHASPLTVAVVGLIAVTTSLSPRDIDSLLTFAESSLLAPYNRWGWAMLLPVAMRATLPIVRFEVVESIVTGAAIALLLLLKITYGVAAIGVFMLALALYPSRWRQAVIVALSLIVIMPILDYITHGQIQAYFSDLVQASKMPANGLRIIKAVSGLPSLMVFTIGSVILMVTLKGNGSHSSWKIFTQNWRKLLLTIAVGLGGLIVLMQNHYFTEAATLLLMPLIIAELTGLTAQVGERKHSYLQHGSSAVITVLFATLTIPTIDAGFIVAQKVQTLRYAPLAAQYSGTEFSGLIVDPALQPKASQPCISLTCSDVLRLETGRDLIARQCPSFRNKAIMSFNFSNPFPAYFGTPSPRYSPIWLHAGRTFSQAEHPPAEKLFSDVGCLMVAKTIDGSAPVLMSIYDKYLQSTFVYAGENTEWKLWVRKL